MSEKTPLWAVKWYGTSRISRVWGRHSPTMIPHRAKWAKGEFGYRGRILLLAAHALTLLKICAPSLYNKQKIVVWWVWGNKFFFIANTVSGRRFRKTLLLIQHWRDDFSNRRNKKVANLLERLTASKYADSLFQSCRRKMVRSARCSSPTMYTVVGYASAERCRFPSQKREQKIICDFPLSFAVMKFSY